MDEGSGQGTYVNQERLEPGQPLVLNVDDLIGFGSSEAQSSRIDGQESFVYRLRAPAAFQSLEAGDDDLDIPDSEAPTPPPTDHHLPDLVRPAPIIVPSIANLGLSNPVTVASSPQIRDSKPSTSSKLPIGSQTSDVIELISIDSSEDDKSMSPLRYEAETETARTDKKRSPGTEESGPSGSVKKLKGLFSSDEETNEKSESQKKELKTNIKSTQNEVNLSSQFSPISSDEEISPSIDKNLPRPALVRAMDLSRKTLAPVKVRTLKSEEEPAKTVSRAPSLSPQKKLQGETPEEGTSTETSSRPEAKISASKEQLEPDKMVKIEFGKAVKPMVKIEFDPNFVIKKEPALELVPVPCKKGGYSSEPEVITLADSDDEDSLAMALSADVGHGSDGAEDHNDHREIEDDSDDEVQIISASETGLFAAISKRIKVEVEEKPSDDGIDNLESDSLDDYHGELDAFINCVIDEVGCNYRSALEGLEIAKDIHKKEDPSVEEVVNILVGVDDVEDVSAFEETIESKFDPKHRNNVKVDLKKSTKKPQKKDSGSLLKKKKLDIPDIDDLLADSSDEEVQKKLINQNGDRKSSSGSLLSEIDYSQPSTSQGSVKPLPTLNNKYKVPKVVKTTKDVDKNSMLSVLKSSRPSRVKSNKISPEQKDKRKQKLAEIERKKVKYDQEVVRDKNVPAGIMKASIPKNQRLLNEFTSTENMQPKRKPMNSFLRTPIPKISKLSLGKNDDSSDSLLSVTDKILHEKNQSLNVQEDLYKETDDGYRVPKKMSVSNVSYNSINSSPSSKEKSQKQMPQSLPLKSIVKKTKRIIHKKIRWKDQDGFNDLTSIKHIPAENQGKKVNKNNNKDFSVKVKVAPVPVSTPDNNDKKIITPDDILMSILHWIPAWLEEQKSQSEPPPVHSPWQLIPVTTTFSSWLEYRRIFLPLMLQELWSSVSRDYEERKGTGGSSLPVFLQEVVMEHGGQFLTVRCLAVMSDRQLRADLCHEGALVQLDTMFTVATPEGKRERQVKPSFAYVWFVQRDLIRKDDRRLSGIGEADSIRVKQLQSLSNKAHGQASYHNLVRITLRTKQNLIPPNSQLSVDRPVKLKSLSRIKPELRKFTALLELPQSRLFDSIIRPSRELVSVQPSHSTLHPGLMTVPALARLNTTQKEIISSVATACVSGKDMAKVCLVQGPPGTGKSSTITGLILQILLCSGVVNNPRSTARILCVAPSNAAVDQLALKLLSVLGQLPEHLRFKLLRLGVNSAMHPAVRPHSFDAVLDQQKVALTRQSKSLESMEKDLRAKQATAEAIKVEQVKAEKAGQKDLAAKLYRDHKDKMQQIEKLKVEMRKPLSSKCRKDTERVAVEKTLAEADVILTTLSSSLTSPMERYLVQGHGLGTSKSVGHMRPVSVCIMDEASQAVEPEALIPLKFGFCKLVMVGDHEQLPATVTSKRAQDLDYQQSLFSRLISFMGSTPGPSPVLKLDTQYRMHPDIGDWPARYFYGGKLSHGSSGSKCNYLIPFTLCNVVGETRQAGGGSWNKVEEKVVMAAIEAVKFLTEEKRAEQSIGVITFYAKQKQNILAEVNRRRLEKTTVNTVDGFQGSERDVIIISCVRSGQGQGIGFLQDRQRLNVALTRAKHCLIVIGDTSALRF